MGERLLPEGTRSLRAAVAAELEALQPELVARAHDITQALLPFRHEIREEYERNFPAGEHDGEAVIILTAGVPGAGKSTLVNTLDDRDSYREIDPDEFKKICLNVADCEGLLDEWTSRTLSDGKQIQPGELATLVHRLSTDLADGLESDCFEQQENFIRQGTFSWDGLPPYYLDSLRVVGGYEGYQIMAVEIGKDRAVEQAGDRWWQARADGDPQARYLSPSVITDMYPSQADRYSTSLSNAVDLINRAESADFDIARLTILDRIDPDQPVTKAYDHDPDHDLTVDEIQRDVDVDRAATQPTTGPERSTGESLLDQVREIRRQADRLTASSSIPGDDDTGAPPSAAIEHNRPDPNVERGGQGTTL